MNREVFWVKMDEKNVYITNYRGHIVNSKTHLITIRSIHGGAHTFPHIELNFDIVTKLGIQVRFFSSKSPTNTIGERIGNMVLKGY